MATRADNHEGSCRQVLTGRHKGKWRVQFVQVDVIGRKRRLSRLFPKQSDGKQFLKGVKSEGASIISGSTSELTLGQWVDWLAENEWPESIAENTLQGRTGRFNKHVRPLWGNVPLTKIDPMAIKAFYRNLKNNAVGVHTIHAIKRDLVRVFNQAISPYKRVPLNWGNPFRLTVETPQLRDAIALTPEQAKKALMSTDLDPERRAMLGLFLLGGVRLSEQMAMTRDQILFDQDLIYVDKAIKIGRNGRQSVGLPKGNKRRLVVMCPTLKRLLKDIGLSMPGDRVIWAAALENKARMKTLAYATWRTVVKDAKLPAEMTPHDCRLTHINWIEKLMPAVSATTLKEHVGHSADGVTEINYTRPITPAQKILRANLEKVAGIKL